MAGKYDLLLFIHYLVQIVTALEKNSDSVLDITIFNGFLNQGISANVQFGTIQGAMDQISYGMHSKISLNSNEKDYVIQFINIPEGDVQQDLTTYGYLTGLESDIGVSKDSLLVIIKSENGQPAARTILFSTNTDGLSRLYFFNAMENSKTPSKGVYVYALYNRLNYDGTRSRSIVQLGNDVPYGEGRESTLLPETSMVIKAFHQAIETVPEFDSGPAPLTSAIEFNAQGGIKSYIVLFGNFESESEPPVISALNVIPNKSNIPFLYKSVLAISLIITVIL